MKFAQKLTTLILCLALCFSLVAVLASCGGEEPSGSDTVVIKYYNGGYGNDWIENIAEEFKDKYPEYKVRLVADANILSSIGSDLENGTDTDLYISHDIQWQYYADMEWLEPLDDLYAMTNGDGDKFEDRVLDSSLASAKYNGKYYKAHWTQGVGGIMYNVDLFEENDWAIPTTYAELVALCDTIVAAAIPNSDESDIVRPFTWSGKEEWMWDYTVFEWWAQLAGLDKIADLMEYEDADTFNPADNWAEMKQAFTLWYDLLTDTANSVNNVTSQNKTASQQSFILGNAAMIPSAQWLYKEAGGASADFDMAVMLTPKVAGAQTGNLNYNVGFGDSLVIPAGSDAKEAAKKFILFLSEEDNCKSFVQDTDGAYLAFNYAGIDMTSVTSGNAFIASINTKLTTTTNFNLYSQNKITFFNYQKVMPWVNNTYYYKDAYSNKTLNTPTAVMNEVYETAQDNWASWARAAQ